VLQCEAVYFTGQVLWRRFHMKYKKYSSIGTSIHGYQFVLKRFHAHWHVLYRYKCKFIERPYLINQMSPPIHKTFIYQTYII